MLQTASITGFLRTILIIVLVYYAFKLLMRVLAPYMLRYMSKKMQDRYSGQYQQQRRQQPQYKAGETVIDKMPNAQKTSNKTVGEYVDYEEID